MINNILKFDSNDWIHIRFLLFNMIKQFLKGDIHEAKEAYYWLKAHLSYDSKRVD